MTLEEIMQTAVPKRIILRLRVDEFEGAGRSWEQYCDAIAAYLDWAGRPKEEFKVDNSGKHYAHVEPFQAVGVPQTTFHVVLDMEQSLLSMPNLDDVPHEVYQVRRDKMDKL